MKMGKLGSWKVAVVCIAIACAYLAAGFAGGRPELGIGSFLAMLAYLVLLLIVGRRSETVGILRGAPVDERLSGFGLRATATAGGVAITAALALYIWTIWQGGDGYGYMVILVPAALAYFGSILWQRSRG